MQVVQCMFDLPAKLFWPVCCQLYLSIPYELWGVWCMMPHWGTLPIGGKMSKLCFVIIKPERFLQEMALDVWQHKKKHDKTRIKSQIFLNCGKKCPDALHCFNAQNTTRYCSNDQWFCCKSDTFTQKVNLKDRGSRLGKTLDQSHKWSKQFGPSVSKRWQWE